jgi:hypothetical protein
MKKEKKMKKTKINEEMRFSKSDTIYKKKYYDRMFCSANKKKIFDSISYYCKRTLLNALLALELITEE